ncbi:MAG: L-serine ammonia-lyase [Legionellales bacterium]|nr:L-serine ammonia-lyase [Legionellales bacterium]
MSISVFDLFSIGIGPSSSHTVGPMRAANAFINTLKDKNLLDKTSELKTELYGSLALTGKGHGTDIAILNGLEGQTPQDIIPEQAGPRAKAIAEEHQIRLGGIKPIAFDREKQLLFHYTQVLPLHSNGMRFSAYQADGTLLLTDVYYSIGGGFIVDEAHFDEENAPDKSTDNTPFPFASAHELLEICKKNSLSIAEVMMANEASMRPAAEVNERLLLIAKIMRECIERGCQNEGTLPGGLNVRRRAPELFKKMTAQAETQTNASTGVMNWLNLYAMAVNEENAAGGRVVTAPTNGAAGVIPAVLNYYRVFCKDVTDQGIIDFLLTAGAIAILYKKGASISAAEVGCQGEVGVACSMAAGALTSVLGGTLAQIENAAEIGMEHHLGLTCDPIGGLVQIPCIERNAMGAVQAVNIADLALMEDGQHKVSLDEVIATMLQTGKDMKTTYKETALAGLAVKVNQPEC